MQIIHIQRICNIYNLCYHIINSAPSEPQSLVAVAPSSQVAPDGSQSLLISWNISDYNLEFYSYYSSGFYFKLLWSGNGSTNVPLGLLGKIIG